MSSKLIACVMLLSLAVAVPAGATTIMIDDFNNPTLNANWAPSTVLNNGTTGTFVYDTSTHPGLLTYTSSNYDAPFQNVLLRKDYSLGVGETLFVDLANVADWTKGTAFAQETWGGLLLAMDTGVGIPRTNLLHVSYREKGTASPAVYVYYSNHSGTTTAKANVNVVSGSVEYLFISRLTNETYDLGYYKTGDANRTVLLSGFAVDAGYGLGNAIGVYNDIRLNGQVMFDNFRKDDGTVPEPSTLALLAAGLLGLMAYAWRKRK